jgi:hypothetical protein
MARHGLLSIVWSHDEADGVVAMRDAVDKTAPRRPLAFFKTHKTGSTTIGAILFRLAARRGLHIADAGELVLRPKQALAEASRSHIDLAIGHVTKSGGPFKFKMQASLIPPPAQPARCPPMSPTATLDSFYATLLRSTANGSQPLMITALRHPADRSRSHYDYYLRSTGKHKAGLSHWVADTTAWGPQSKLTNFQAAELGLVTAEQVNEFIRTTLKPGLPLKGGCAGFQLVLVAEMMVDSLLLLRRALNRWGWNCDLLDVLHLSQTMSRNWKGQTVQKSSLSRSDREVHTTLLADPLRALLIWWLCPLEQSNNFD